MHEEVRRILQGSAITFSEQHHRDMGKPIRSPHDFALALGYELGRISKTLLMRAANREDFYLIVLSCNERVDTAALTRALRINRLQMASKQELAKVLSYPQTGVSPINSKGLPVIIDLNLMQHSTVLIGSGEIGSEIELSPQDLQQITNATIVPFTV